MNWTITRQELLLFHARHKRMRFVYKHDGEVIGETQNEAFKEYRQHAQSILNALEEVFRDFREKGAEIGVANDISNGTRNFRLEITIPGDLDKGRFLAYLIYWRMCLRYEGWHERTNPNRIVVDVIRELGNKIREHGPSTEISFEVDCTEGGSDRRADESEENYKKRVSEGKHAIITLISTLPISPHWDLWGVFSKDCGKDTLLSKMKNCASPLYAAQLRYHSEAPPAAQQGTRSRDLLGYLASLRACYSDTSREGFSPIFVSEQDYYHYCHDPDLEDGNPDQKNNNLNLYRTYGILYDALTVALSGKQTPEHGGRQDEAQGQATGKEKVLFYIAYPIRTSLGRLHFWHLWLRPDRNDATLEQLWASWWPLHQHFLNWPELHTSLATELEQLDIAYAQGEILSDIAECINKGDPFFADKSVCDHAYMLFPVECVCTSDYVWNYHDYRINRIPGGDKSGDHFQDAIGDLLGLNGIADNDSLKEFFSKITNDGLELIFGHKWERAKNKVRGKSNSCESCDEFNKGNGSKYSIIFLNKEKTNKNNLQRHRYRRLIEQQRFLAERMNLSVEAKMTREERDRERAAEELRQLLTSKSPWNEDALTALADESVWREHQLLEDNEAPALESGGKLTKAGAIAACLFGTDNPRQQLVALLSGGLHLLLSGILELHPVKGYTHSMPEVESKQFLLKWTKEKITEVLNKYLQWLPEGTHPRYCELEKHLGDIRDAIADWLECKCLNDTPLQTTTLTQVQTDSSHPAAKLKDLRIKDSNEVRGKLNQAIDGNGTLLRNSEADSSDSANSFRSSLPVSVVYPDALVRELVALAKRVSEEHSVFWRIFGLPLSAANPWTPALFRNYLAVMYTLDPASGEKVPNIFAKIEEQLKVVSGRLVVVVKNGGLEWKTIQQSASGYGYSSISQDACWPDGNDPAKKTEYSLLFEDQRWNTVVLWAFDGWYMPEGSK